MIRALILFGITFLALLVFIALYIDETRRVQETYHRQYRTNLQKVSEDIQSYVNADGDLDLRYTRIVSDMSAANAFAVWMHELPNVTLVGDHTGGGSGMPLNNSLPNGWSVRFSACPMYDNQKQQTEFGIDPDVKVSLNYDLTYGDEPKDDIIEAARQLLVK